MFFDGQNNMIKGTASGLIFDIYIFDIMYIFMYIIMYIFDIMYICLIFDIMYK